MTRYAAIVEYCGARYSGWQKQKDQRSIQQQIEQALSAVADSPVQATAAGRTDKGVHALQQVIHFDSESKRKESNWLHGANRHLPEDIKLRTVQTTDYQFHARHSASYRRYIYFIYNHPTASAIFSRYCCWHSRLLDIKAMQQAAGYLVGNHDFAAFRSSDCNAANTCRTVQHAFFVNNGAWIAFDIQAKAFLHKMVRMIVAQLLLVGRGMAQPATIAQLLKQGEREKKRVAPPEGLLLAEIGYPPDWGIATAAAEQQWPYMLATGNKAGQGV